MSTPRIMCRWPLVAALALIGVLAFAVPASAAALTPKQELGKQLFFDTDLSTPPGQSCASCHDPAAGWADPRQESPTSEGAVPGRFGSRNAPSAAYAAMTRQFTFLPGMGPMGMGVYAGGQNWDGRAVDLTEQATLPFLNPLEMNNPSELVVVLKVRNSPYADLFREVYGQESLSRINRRETARIDYAYECIADAIAAYERSSELNAFSSRYDRYLAGEPTLNEQELRGMALFQGKAACNRCHPSLVSASGASPTFASFHHANTGVPKNPDNPFYTANRKFNSEGFGFIDLGTGLTVDDPFHYGRFKIPTLRNIAETAPYMHNGALPDLKSVVHFYNTRDVASEGWPAPEWSQNIIRADNLGNLGLTEQEEDDIVAFLSALSDE